MLAKLFQVKHQWKQQLYVFSPSLILRKQFAILKPQPLCWSSNFQVSLPSWWKSLSDKCITFLITSHTRISVVFLVRFPSLGLLLTMRVYHLRQTAWRYSSGQRWCWYVVAMTSWSAMSASASFRGMPEITWRSPILLSWSIIQLKV